MEGARRKSEMNADKMTRDEFFRWYHTPRLGSRNELNDIFDWFETRFNAIQSAPFVPDWSLKPEWAKGFSGTWAPADISPRPGEFYLPAPSNPTDAELSAMWEKLDKDKRVQILRDAGVMV